MYINTFLSLLTGKADQNVYKMNKSKNMIIFTIVDMVCCD